MDPLSGAASVIAVISLVIQLGNSAHKLSKLLKSIKNAPKELRTLDDDLDRLRDVLAEIGQIAETQKIQESAPAPSFTLLRALESCNARFRSLETCVSKIALSSLGKGQIWASFKTRSRRDDLQNLYDGLRKSIDHLNTLLILNTANLGLANLGQVEEIRRCTSDSFPPTVSLSSALQASNIPRFDHPYKQHAFQQAAQVSNTLFRWHLLSQRVSEGKFLGVLNFCIASRQLSLLHNDASVSRQEQVVKEEWSLALVVWFTSRWFEFQSRRVLGQVERRWRVCPIDVECASPAWDLCEDGDVKGVLKLFSHGLSPFIKDKSGKTLLNVAAQNCQPDLCRALLQLGVPLCPYQEEYPWGTLPMDYPLYAVGMRYGTMRTWDTVKLLAEQEEGLATLILAFDQGDILYQGEQGVIHWQYVNENISIRASSLQSDEAGTDVDSGQFQILHFLLGHYFSKYSEPTKFQSIACVLRTMYHKKLGAMLEGNISILNQVFEVNGFDIAHTDIDIWKLEAASELRGQAWCSLLEESGFNVDSYVQKTLNNGRDIYLKPVECGERGASIRRLVRGRTSARSLRWEWIIAPVETTHKGSKELDHLYFDRDEYGVFKDPESSGWPFCEMNYCDNRARRIKDQKDMRLNVWKRKKEYRLARKKDTSALRLQGMPGGFPS